MMKNVRRTKRSTGSLRHLFVSAVVLMLLAVLCVAPAAAESVSTCDHDTWTAWESAYSLPTEAGSYYLTTDVTLSTTWEVPFGGVNLCLNGKTIKLDDESSGSVISIKTHSDLAVYDCSEPNTGKITGGKGTGTMDGICGGGVYIVDGSFTMKGGNIVENTALNGGGGGVFIIRGTLTLENDATISNNSAAYGGGVLAIDATLVMESGNITQNTATELGGGAAILTVEGKTTNGNDGTFIMNGGNIVENTAMNGGGVTVFTVVVRDEINGHVTFLMNGGNIYGNTADGGSGVFVSRGSAIFSGSAVVDADNEVYLSTDGTMSVAGTSFTGEVKNINGDPSTITPGYELVTINSDTITASAILNQFGLSSKHAKYSLTPSADGKKLVVAAALPEDDEDEVVYPTPITCDHKAWTAWGDDETEKTSLPTGAGNYYLVSDITLDHTWQYYGSMGSSPVVNLCLNGNVVILETTTDSSVISVSGTLNLYDCGITPHYFTVEENGLWKLTDTQTADTKTVIGGVITGGFETSGGGRGVYVSGDFNMYGGNIVGNSGACGGGVYVSGNFTMYDGNIIGNYANQGAGVAVQSYNDGKFIMYGGNISENTAKATAGGVYVLSGTFIMNDGNITGNTARPDGGGLDVCDTFIMNGGMISGNTAWRSGAAVNLDADATFTMNGGSIINNINNVNGQYMSGTIHVGGGSSGGSFTLKDGVISGNTGGSAILAYANAVITMDGGEIKKNTGANYGGGIYLYGASLIMSNGTISENSAKYGGSGVYVRNDTSELGDFKGTLTVSKNAKISADNDVYLAEDGMVINVTGDSFTGETKNISGVSIYPGYELIKITSDTIKASSVKDKFALKSTHTGYSLTADDTANVIKVTTSGGSSGGGEVTPTPTPSTPQPSLPFTAAKDTRAQLSAVTAAEVKYSLTPAQFADLTAPTIVHGKSSLLMTNVSVMKISGGVETKVPATVNADGTITITGSIDDADSLSVTFPGSTLGDVTNDGKPDTLDAARILQASAKLYTLDTDAQFYGDVSGDGDTNTLDAARILQYSAKLTDNNYNLVS